MPAIEHESLPRGQVAAILPAAGQSRRFSAVGMKKVFAPLAGQPVWEHAVRTLRSRPEVGPIVMVIDPEDRPGWEAAGDRLAELAVRLCEGGRERIDSVQRGLALVEECPLVAIHDAARPLVPAADVAAVIAVAHRSGAALLATPVRATLKRADRSGAGCQTVDRSGLWEALTPQVFRTEILRAAYERWQGRPATDDAQLVERSGFPVQIVSGSAVNLKITQPEDLALAEALAMLERSGKSASGS